MPDVPFVREIGRVRDVFGSDLIVGVELNTVTLSHEPDLRKVQLTDDAAEEFGQLFIRACWVAARQDGTP